MHLQILLAMIVAVQSKTVHDRFNMFRQPKFVSDTTPASSVPPVTLLSTATTSNNHTTASIVELSTSAVSSTTMVTVTKIKSPTTTAGTIATSTKKVRTKSKPKQQQQQIGSGATTTFSKMQTTQRPLPASTEDGAVSFKAVNNTKINKYFPNTREKLKEKIAANISQNLLPLPNEAEAALVKPTKYHYYPHNQHIYLLPECAIQQVCNAVYVRLNWTQPLCACPSRYKDPCSASLNSDDLHTTELIIDRSMKRALTLVKTCEPTADMRLCRTPRDWSLLALQNIRTGKSHYLVICRCPETSILEGPMSHDQPTYASVPGIKVYGMMCVNGQREGRPLHSDRSERSFPFSFQFQVQPSFPWHQVRQLIETTDWNSQTFI